MKRENDEITDLFRSRLSGAEMKVRDGFWEELEKTIPAACQQRRRLMMFRVAAVASVLLVLAASSATFWYLSPKEEIEQAFAKVALSANTGVINGDGVQTTPLPLPAKPVMQRPAPKTFGLLTKAVETGCEAYDSIASFTVTIFSNFGNDRRPQSNGMWKTGVGDEPTTPPAEDVAVAHSSRIRPDKVRSWAVKPQIRAALPAGNGVQKVPLTVGATLEKKLNSCFGIETGLLYSHLRSSRYKLHYLGIPLKLNVKIADIKKFELYATAGAIADKCIAGASDNDFDHEPVRLAITAGVGLNYKINDRLAIFAEPGVSHYFKTDSKIATVQAERPTQFNLICGLRMTY